MGGYTIANICKVKICSTSDWSWNPSSPATALLGKVALDSEQGEADPAEPGMGDLLSWASKFDLKNNRRKFRSQTSDNMDRWKAEQGRGREKRKIRREKIRRERVRRQKMQMREKVGKSRNTVFFQWFGAPEGQKVGSLKRRARSQLARWEMKKCTPLWREAHLEVKMYKTHQGRTTMSKKCTPLWREESRCTKHTMVGPLLEVAMSKKCTPLWREAHFEVNMLKNQGHGRFVDPSWLTSWISPFHCSRFSSKAVKSRSGPLFSFVSTDSPIHQRLMAHPGAR